jgi:hypothetical protein
LTFSSATVYEGVEIFPKSVKENKFQAQTIMSLQIINVFNVWSLWVLLKNKKNLIEIIAFKKSKVKNWTRNSRTPFLKQKICEELENVLEAFRNNREMKIRNLLLFQFSCQKQSIK